MDASESAWFGAQLSEVRSGTYEIETAARVIRDLIPTNNTSVPDGEDAYTYTVFDKVGYAKFIAGYSRDLPRVDLYARKEVGRVKTLGDSYGYNIMESKRAARMGIPLEQRKAAIAREAIDDKMASVAISGDSEHNILGLLNQPNVTVYVPPAGASTFYDWPRKTVDEILADMFGIADSIRSVTKRRGKPNTLLMSGDRYSLISRRRLDTNGTETILSFFTRTHPTLKNIEQWDDLATAGAGGTQRMMAYEKNPRVLELIVPNEFEQLEEEKRGMEYVTDCIASTGGVVVYFPAEVAYSDGV